MQQLDQAERSASLYGSSVVVSYFLVFDDRPRNYLTFSLLKSVLTLTFLYSNIFNNLHYSKPWKKYYYKSLMAEEKLTSIFTLF